MSRTIAHRHAVSATSLIDDVMSVLARGETALFGDLAQAAWQPQATLASLTNSASTERRGEPRDAA